MQAEKLFACIISEAGDKKLIEIAQAFSPTIERLEHGVLFDVGGTERLFGGSADLAARISKVMATEGVTGNLAISTKIESAVLVAENRSGVFIVGEKELDELPVHHLPLKNDLEKIFSLLGIKTVKELKKIPEAQLIARYGHQFRKILDQVHLNGKRTIQPNVKENKLSWSYDLDFAVQNLDQLTFLLAHGLDDLCQGLSKQGVSTEQVDIDLGLENGDQKHYSITISFPSVDVKFWRRLIDLRLSENLPGDAITGMQLTVHFAKPRAAQMGLFAAVAPDPESLLLTIKKIGKLIGATNVGIPVMLNKRISRPFKLDDKKLPSGRPSTNLLKVSSGIAFSHFEPELTAWVTIENRRLVYLKTSRFKGRVTEYGGVWRGSSQWWNHEKWKSDEWDVALESGAVYRLVNRKEGWFVTGAYV